MDDAQAQRTLWIGLVIAAAIFAMSFVVPFLVPGQTGQWVSVGLTATMVVFTLVWFLAARRGFRVGKPATRAELRAKEKVRAEREKKMKLSRR